MSPLRVLLIAENFPPKTGGAARRFWEIYRRQSLDRVRVVTVAAEDPAAMDPPWVRRLSKQSTLRDFSGAIRTWPFGPTLQSLRDIVRSDGIERIHCGRPLPEGWLALALKALDGIPFDCFVHGEEINKHGTGEHEGFLLSRRYRAMTGLALRGASRVIANSESTAAIVRDQWRVAPGRVRISLPGVDTRFFAPASPTSAAAFPEWRNRRVVLCASRLQARKGQDMLMRAVAQAREAAPEVLLVLAGDGPQAAVLRRQASELGLERHVSFLGEVDEPTLRSCYQEADLFALANRQIGTDLEGFGMVLLEAQSCGTPVIAGDSGGTAEALVEGRTGMVVDCTSVAALARAIEELLTDDKKRTAMSAAARDLMLAKFDWDDVAAQAGWLFEASE